MNSRGDTEDRDMAQITSRPADTEKWFRIIDEYMAANVMLSVFMHYAIVAVFALNFTIDFYTQVKYCEIITITVFFIVAFCAVYKIKIFVNIGVAPTKKTN